MNLDPTETELELEKLSEQEHDFDCLRKEQTDYFRNRAWSDQVQNVTVTYVLKHNGAVAGFLSLTMDGISVSLAERPVGVHYSKLPAIKIAQIGIHKDRSGIGLGKYLVSLALVLAKSLRDKVGCRFVTVDSKNDLIGWYENQGFVRSELENLERLARLEKAHMSQKRRMLRLTQLPTSMKFDLNRIECP